VSFTVGRRQEPRRVNRHLLYVSQRMPGLKTDGGSPLVEEVEALPNKGTHDTILIASGRHSKEHGG
jgi:hypothetical protein